MATEIWPVQATDPEPKTIQAAARIIREGGLVAFPTETVYGLGANGLDPGAVHKIFTAKGRPADNPLILHIAENRDIFYLAETVPLKAQILMEIFWPGPLTLVLPKRSLVPPEVTAGLDTVAVRMPQHAVALALIRESGVPIAAPSANRSGYPSPTRASHVWDDLAGRVDVILDGGPTGLGLESTVLDLSGEIPLILRPGGITWEQLTTVLGRVDADPGMNGENTCPRAPGMKYTHYSPRAEVILLDGDPEGVGRRVLALLAEYSGLGKRVALLLTDEVWQKLGSTGAAYTRNLGSRQQLSRIAHNIYSELRSCDEAGVDVVLTETYKQEGLGTALMNRLLKSAGYRVISSSSSH